ncbi:AI-2E family transporter [Domibacillus enclensis]|uniref:AI-2E family transporter n=1 Tax=Domibacillus enclensis TaxID=1017273 RepID=A0A1N6R3Q5_9BACI|nr:AI-2E family transporter [Domibacillus enclensis]OXS78940.1 AI-2E family transporter [Domibacillus enclensis]SIQ23423.1 Predicted PurR-regulated permease PerM [Domibacillus enclensis]
MTNKLWFQAGIGILLAMLIIFMFQEIHEVFQPIVIIAKTIFLPLLIGGVLFYLTRPLLHWLESKKFPRWASITSVLAVVIFVFWLIYAMIGPVIGEQSASLAKNTPEMIEEGEKWFDYLLSHRDDLPPQAQDSVESAISNVSNNVNDWAVGFGTWLLSFLQGFVQGLFLLILAPFFLVYMLKDHEKFAPFVAGFFSGERKTWMRKTLHDLDVTLRSYIQGQLLVSFLVGLMLLIGYLIIGLDYALLLALFGMFTNVIPFLGPYIAVVPAMFIALLQEPQMALYVAIIMLVAQQIESNFISPNVMGKALDIHPLTVITVILAAGNIAGIWGVILAIPFYAVVKTILSNLYQKRTEIREAAGKEIE